MKPNSIGETTSHVCEIDNFWWKFDLLFVRKNIREYCIQTDRNQPVKPKFQLGQTTDTIAEVQEDDLVSEPATPEERKTTAK